MITDRDDGKQFDEERLYLYQLIVNTELLASCRDVLSPQLASNKYTGYLLEWIIEYYDAYGKAPGQDITSVFAQHKNDIDADEANNIRKLLENLSGDEDNFVINNVEHNTNNIIAYFNWRALQDLESELKKANRVKDIKYAQTLLTKFKRVEKTKCDVYDPFEDFDETAESFDINNDERLFSVDGELGVMLGKFLRGDLVGVIAGSKAGKSWFCLFLALVAVSCKLKVIYFNLEITKKQFARRVWQALNNLPKEPGTYRIPYFDKHGDICFEEIVITADDMITGLERIKKRAKALKRQMRGCLKVVHIPRGQATTNMIFNKIEQLEKELGFVGDLVVIDNPDVVQHEKAADENVAEANSWMKFAGKADELNQCWIAPTQGNRNTYGGKKFGMMGMGGSYRKVTHVGKMIQITMGEKEKQEGYSRVKLFEGIERDDDLGGGEVIVLTCLALGQWCIDSRFANQTNVGRE